MRTQLLSGLEQAHAGDTADDVADAPRAVEHAKHHTGVEGLVAVGGLVLKLLAHAAEGGTVSAREEAEDDAEEGQDGHGAAGGEAPEEPHAQGGGDARQRGGRGGGEGVDAVVAQVAEEGAREDAGDVEEGEQQRGRGGGEAGLFVRVAVDVGLRDAVAGRLQRRGHDEDVERAVGEKVPCRAAGWTSGTAGTRAARGVVVVAVGIVVGMDECVTRQQGHCNHARAGDDGGPDAHRAAEAVGVEKAAQQERTRRAHDVLGREYHPVRQRAVVDGEALAQRKRRGAVEERGPEGGEHPLRRYEVP